MTGGRKKVIAALSDMLLYGRHVQKEVALASFEGRLLGSLTSEGHPSDTCPGPVGESVVLNSLNWLKLKLGRS